MDDFQLFIDIEDLILDFFLETPVIYTYIYITVDI